MNWQLAAGITIGAVALATTAVTSYSFVIDAGGDTLHAAATPLCLEAFALVALSYRRYWVFSIPFVTAVAINIAHGFGQGSPVLAAVYALPPLAAAGATHVLLGDRPTRRPADADAADVRVRRVVASDQPTPKAVQVPQPAANSNGQSSGGLHLVSTSHPTPFGKTSSAKVAAAQQRHPSNHTPTTDQPTRTRQKVDREQLWTRLEDLPADNRIGLGRLKIANRLGVTRHQIDQLANDDRPRYDRLTS